jgi:serine/threonine-protein kinase
MSLAADLADRYRIEKELERGASAVVYLAEDLRHGRRVALKVVHAALGEAVGQERFQREIRTLARLHHPHILPLFDSGVAGGRLFYAMPYVEGGSLRERLQREGRLPVETALRIAGQLSSALTYAHALGVVHRDITPENIMLSGDGHALLTDFGIAYAIEDGVAQGSGQRLTETGVALGTPEYMSPEQSSGEEPVDARSDVYSLACVLFEALVGRPPFTGPNARAIMARRLVEDPPSLRPARPEVSAEVEAAIRRAMARRPGDRFESVAEFRAALTSPLTDSSPSLALRPASADEPKRPRSRLRPMLLAGLGLLAALAVGYAVLRSRPAPSPPAAVTAGPRMLAVLPFKNLGSAEEQYFADGLTEEITSRLAGFSGLRVISRTSADQYRSTTKSLEEIGGELGAAYVLEGSVRWERGGTAGRQGRIRVNPTLIRVDGERRLWSETYEAELTDVFRIQSEIAQHVTDELNVAIQGAERAALMSPGTGSTEAYDLYLRGNDYLGRSNQQGDLSNAASLFQQAVAADPRFAMAYAKLARTQTQIYWHHYDHTPARLGLARAALDSAIRLGPDLPETHMARGFFQYWGSLDYENALREFEAALRIQPSNSELLQAIGYVERRRGRWEESLARLVEALRYDPRSGVRSFEVGDNYFSLRLFGEADRYLDRAMTLSPDLPNPYIYRAWLHVVWRGDLARARAIIGQGLNRIEAGRFAPALQTGDRVSASIVTADSTFWPMLDGLSLQTFTGDAVRYHLLKAEAAHFQGQPAAERAHGDSARALIEPRDRSTPNDAKILATLSLAYSHMGRHADAIRVGERAAELLPVSQDAVSGPFIVSYLARVYTTAGRQDQAVDILERLIGVPSWISADALRVDPIWDPLRSNPRFRRLAGITSSRS